MSKRQTEAVTGSQTSEAVTDNQPTETDRPIHDILKNLLAGHKGILVGYSGGADSTALLYMLYRYVGQHNRQSCDSSSCQTDLYLKAVHIHHGIRGEEADRDAMHCQHFCDKFGIDFTLIKADIPTMAKETHIGIEETARNFRYSTFAELVQNDSRLDCIATAHNANDNAETLLFRLIRGTGIDGLSGIPQIRITDGIPILRPLLTMSKREILAYCDGNRLAYIHDSTNDDTAYTRNYIRHELLPRMEKINPAFLKAVERLTVSAKEDSDYLESVAAEFVEKNETSDNGISLAALQKLPRPILSRVLRRRYAKAGDTAATSPSGSTVHSELQYVHIEALTEFVTVGQDGSMLSLPNRQNAVIEKKTLYFRREVTAAKATDGFCYPIKIGVNVFEKEDFAFILIPQGENNAECKKDYENFKNIYKLSIQSKLKSDTINHGFYVRSRKDGDSYRFGKMTRKLKQLYHDRGYSQEVRTRLPLLCDKDGIVWIPSFRAADRMSVSQSEKAETESVIFDVLYYSNLTIGENIQ